MSFFLLLVIEWQDRRIPSDDPFPSTFCPFPWTPRNCRRDGSSFAGVITLPSCIPAARNANRKALSTTARPSLTEPVQEPRPAADGGSGVYEGGEKQQAVKTPPIESLDVDGGCRWRDFHGATLLAEKTKNTACRRPVGQDDHLQNRPFVVRECVNDLDGWRLLSPSWRTNLRRVSCCCCCFLRIDREAGPPSMTASLLLNIGARAAAILRPAIELSGRLSDVLLTKTVWVQLVNAGKDSQPIKVVVRRRADVYDLVSASLRELYGSPSGLQPFCTVLAPDPEGSSKALVAMHYSTVVYPVVRNNGAQNPIRLWIDLARAHDSLATNCRPAEPSSSRPPHGEEDIAQPRHAPSAGG